MSTRLESPNIKRPKWKDRIQYNDHCPTFNNGQIIQQKINKERMALISTLEQVNLTEICRTFHTTAEESHSCP
jgi:hypothetical protein